jgi:hypothetical protein
VKAWRTRRKGTWVGSFSLWGSVRAKTDLVPDCDLHGLPMYREQCRASALGFTDQRDIHIWRCVREGCGRYFYGTVGYRHLSQCASTPIETPRCVGDGAYLVAQRNLGLYICPIDGCTNAQPWTTPSVRESGPSGPDRGEENLPRVRAYLVSLKAASQPLPITDGRPDIHALAEAAGVLPNVFDTNSDVKQLLAEFMGELTIAGAESGGNLSRTRRQRRIKPPSAIQLEQQLTSARADTEELRKRLAAVEEKLARYAITEERSKSGNRGTV